MTFAVANQDTVETLTNSIIIKLELKEVANFGLFERRDGWGLLILKLTKSARTCSNTNR